MDRLAELAGYAQSFPGMVDDDFIAAGFTPEEISSYRSQTAPQFEQFAPTGDILTAPDYTMRERAVQGSQDFLSNTFGMNPYSAGVLSRNVLGDPNSSRSNYGMGIADFTPLGAVFATQEGSRTASRGYEAKDPVQMGLGGLEVLLGVAEGIPIAGRAVKPLSKAVINTVEEVFDTPFGGEVLGYLRGVRDLDADFLRGRGDPALAQGVGADVPGRPPLTFDEVEAAMKAETLAPQISISETIKSKYPDVKIDLFGNPEKGYELSRIVVPKEGRSSGVGTQVMEDIIQMADAQGAKVSLTPDTEFGGTSVSRLKDFYKRFGFVENKGRNKDFSTRNTMYRNPQSKAPAKPTAAELRRQANIQRFGYDPSETPATVDTSYRGGHQPRGPQDENPVRLDDITISTTGESAGYPSDFYGSSGSRYYAPGPRFADDQYGIANQQSYRAIMKAKGNPDAEVTIYRAVPNEDSITSINEGDFVTLSPKYAEIHGAEGYGPNGNDAGKVISQKVKVKDIYFAGDDVNEFGYYPSNSK
jgi:GNAT superfamily N-acetyltransferase